MIKHKQQTKTDCMRTALASILEYPDCKTIPDFYADGDNEKAFADMLDWLAAYRGLSLMTLYFPGDLTPFDVRYAFGQQNPGLFYLMIGAKHETHHAIVCRNEDVVCDPAAYEEDFTGPMFHGHWLIAVLVSLEFYRE